MGRSVIDEGPSDEDLARFGGQTAHCPGCGAEIWGDTPICPACRNIVEGGPTASATRRRLLIAVLSVLLVIALLALTM